MVELVVIGKIGRPFGVQGWSKINSFTQPEKQILAYKPWFLKYPSGWQPSETETIRWSGQQVIAKFANINLPEQARLLTNLLIGVEAGTLPPKADNEYYWYELEGLRVTTTQGVLLGKIEHLLATGAHDIVVVKGDKEHIFPYILNEIIVKIDLAKGEMVVNWDPDA